MTLLDIAALSAWPTPTAQDSESSGGEGALARGTRRPTLTNLTRAPWATPTAVELGNSLETYAAMKANMKSGARVAFTSLSHQAQLVAISGPAGWTTPMERDYRSENLHPVQRGTAALELSKQAQLTVIGEVPHGYGAATGKRAQLNPELPRWLMGLPPVWASCAPTVMPSSRKPRKQ